MSATTLYRAYSSDEELLYVGIASDWSKRWRQHAKNAPWFNEVAQIRLEAHPDRASAEAAEIAAIKSEHPAYNVQNARPPTPTRPRARTPDGRLAYSVTEAAAALGVSGSAVRKLVVSGELPSFKLGGKRLIARPDLEAWLTGESW